jgi:hypothetical protein
LSVVRGREADITFEAVEAEQARIEKIIEEERKKTERGGIIQVPDIRTATFYIDGWNTALDSLLSRLKEPNPKPSEEV